MSVATLALCACQADDESLEPRFAASPAGPADPACAVPVNSNVNPRRSLFETHEEALVHFTMAGILGAIATNDGLVSTPAATHDQLIDTYNVGPGLGLGVHCDDDVSFAGGPGLNGYPLQCPRAEGQQLGNLDVWFPIAAVNRFDLAPADGAHCGEARLVMANDADIGPGRMFTIFEAQVPNPDPGCGVEACRPVQKFWANLSSIDDPAVRADQLRMAFLDGHPALEAAGFEPFMRARALTFGTGQIRTNNFDQGPWTLREFKAIAVEPSPGETQVAAAAPVVAPAPGLLRMVEVPVAANPFGQLWNENISLPDSVPCQRAILETVESLMDNNPNTMGVHVPVECLAAESPDGFIQEYDDQMVSGGVLAAQIDATIAAIDPTSPLTAIDIARRAMFAGGCIGCHQRSNGFPNNQLGDGVQAPPSLGFVHTHESAALQEDCGDGDVQCFRISPALKNSFLPHRKQVMDDFLTSGGCCNAAVGQGAGPVAPMDEADVDVEALMEQAELQQAAGAALTVSGAPVGRAH
ncbi:MAG: hypothetical protein K0V04_09110 [Deltaproteobacteria bacterium]|nr:hypothetical protein [Deltaproteobacteria bacterium]